MARPNRRDVLTDGEVQIVHCVNRCVRRAFLCGNDALTGRNYDYRRQMIRHRLEFLAGIMAIEVLGYSILSNHFHTILRSRPDVVRTWSDEEIVLKWWMLCPARRNHDGSPAQPTDHELRTLLANRHGIKEKRRRLSSISWCMRFVCERIARQSNREDNCTGRFWEGRFKAQVLQNDAAILACLQYVDLNPLRAGIARTIEDSDFTSVQDRIRDLQYAVAQHATGAAPSDATSSDTNSPLPAAALNTAQAPVSDCAEARATDQNHFDLAVEHGSRAGWLAPVPLEPQQQAVRVASTSRRASNKGFLALELGEYLQLLDWTACQISTHQRNAPPDQISPLFDRLEIPAELWVDSVLNFRRWFRSAIIGPETILNRNQNPAAKRLVLQQTACHTQA